MYNEIKVYHGFGQLFVHHTLPVAQHVTHYDPSRLMSWYTAPIDVPTQGHVMDIPKLGAYVVTHVSCVNTHWTAILQKQQ